MSVHAALLALGRAEAPGMHPDGDAFDGILEEGQSLEQSFTIRAGKCYAILGAGLGIHMLDMHLIMAMPPMPPTIAMIGVSKGPTVTIGGKDTGGWTSPLEVDCPGKIVLMARRGAGAAAGQIYVK